MKKNNSFKRLMIKLVLFTIRNSIFFVVGVAKIIYDILKLINRLVVVLFKKMPKTAQVVTIYILVGLSVAEILNIGNVRTITNEIVKTQIKYVPFVVTEQVQAKETEKEIEIQDLLENENAKNIYNESINQGLSKKQALLVVSISQHETGYWKSSAFIDKHNFGGVMCNTGLRVYENYNDGLSHFVRLLKNYYFNLGLDTVEKIGAKYCPVGAANDPHNLNKNWVPSVTQFYNNYLQKAGLQ